MNVKPIEQAKDRDLAQSLEAMRRAARRARELAVRTGTHLVVQRNGQIEHLQVTSSESTDRR